MKLTALLKSIAALAVACSFSAAHAAWPERPITLIVPWAAGGGTDATARIVGALLEKELGQPVNVVNRAGGNGVVGHQAIAGAQADGYTLGMITVEISMMHHQGLTQLTPKNYTPLALMNVDPAAVTVSVASPYKNMDDLMKAIRANPGKLKASGTGQGGIWHLALAGMLKDLKLEASAVPWVPSNGAAPAMLELAAGGVDIVTAALPEARSLIDAGKARPLAVMADAPAALYPNVPTLKSATGSGWTIGVWRGIAGPKGLPADVQAKMETVLKKINGSKEYQDFMAGRGFGVAYADGAGFGKFMEKGDADMGQILGALGMAR
ncbi:tripartite tricarboxylate transporter substrate binding protein [Rhodoferax sp.]|uniref:tripartite tricarboxylate transporter substrate binding protein n=2 Tax=Rhodoferax sp. TaxID=50421 RepID=UPI00271BEF1C|nr:tripartite tricarboxylate transporter substrate binding protein [Rhodoferax sp.]MDO9143799.1 tripartite tricarboxylate transporter substrate binding protein [Rhodoferax sp.]MDP2442334.1 tripartite tricarboxylate transporter substrate binding protein [Rhodoferax sp.]MDP3193064.1 tripartite tricarboxylate transporter substrate binding protein [Rhodoferax sp.]MDP3865036.1 tripartite tricarboxylate transporter substrate binding protein [Rhodoferax sp.]MDZ4208199.1 tripartite tricarboxylate tran